MLWVFVQDSENPIFDPRTRAFSEEELRPQPILRKRKKQHVSDEMKNEQYWQKRIKNNNAARKSREAKRLRENQVSFIVINRKQGRCNLLKTGWARFNFRQHPQYIYTSCTNFAGLRDFLPLISEKLDGQMLTFPTR